MSSTATHSVQPVGRTQPARAARIKGVTTAPRAPVRKVTRRASHVDHAHLPKEQRGSRVVFSLEETSSDGSRLRVTRVTSEQDNAEPQQPQWWSSLINMAQSAWRAKTPEERLREAHAHLEKLEKAESSLPLSHEAEDETL